jgi:hypothetical protein
LTVPFGNRSVNPFGFARHNAPPWRQLCLAHRIPDRLAASIQLGRLSRSKRRDSAMTSCKVVVLTCILAALSFTRRMFS